MRSLWTAEHDCGSQQALIHKTVCRTLRLDSSILHSSSKCCTQDTCKILKKTFSSVGCSKYSIDISYLCCDRWRLGNWWHPWIHTSWSARWSSISGWKITVREQSYVQTLCCSFFTSKQGKMYIPNYIMSRGCTVNVLRGELSEKDEALLRRTALEEHPELTECVYTQC